MKTVIATIIETNEYKVKIDVEDGATEDEIRDIIEEAYLEDDCNMGIVSSAYDIKIKNSRWIKMEEEQCPCDDCNTTCDYWDSKYCCTFCRWQYGDIEPDCENCDPMDNWEDGE